MAMTDDVEEALGFPKVNALGTTMLRLYLDLINNGARISEEAGKYMSMIDSTCGNGYIYESLPWAFLMERKMENFEDVLLYTLSQGLPNNRLFYPEAPFALLAHMLKQPKEIRRPYGKSWTFIAPSVGYGSPLAYAMVLVHWSDGDDVWECEIRMAYGIAATPLRHVNIENSDFIYSIKGT